MRRRIGAGFTLVELLVVIAIISVLIALLLPALQAAREASRNAQCTSQMKQIALACLQHETTHEFFPTGGWGSLWAGDPDQGFKPTVQPGGWMFNILPYMDLLALHDMGLNANQLGRTTTQATQVPFFLCPSRSRVSFSVSNGVNAFPFNPQSGWFATSSGSWFYNTS